MTSGRDDPDFGAMGRLPIFQYWDDWMTVSTWLSEEQLLRSTGVWQRAATGEDGPRGLWRDWIRLSWGWWSMMAGLWGFPIEWAARRGASTPNLVFAVDDACQSPPPQAAHAAIDARGLTLGATDLQQVGGPGRVPSSCVEVRLLDRGARVQVTLVNLGGDASAQGNRLDPGLYAGLAYAYERPNLRPLAMVILYVDRAAEIPPKHPVAHAKTE